MVASVTSALPTPWRYQGRILESAAGTPALYDFAARSYNPGLGTFTSLDTKLGSAQNPALLNGYLYANANPATLIDPDGHCSSSDGYNGCNQESSPIVTSTDMSTAVYNSQHQSSPVASTSTDMSTSVYNSQHSSATSSGDACTYVSGAATCGSGGVNSRVNGERPVCSYSDAAQTTTCTDGRVSGPAKVPTPPKTTPSKKDCSWNPLDGKSCEAQMAGAAVQTAISIDKCTISHDCKEFITGAEDVTDVHTVGWCLTGSLFVGFMGLGAGGFIQACVMVTGKGQVGTTFSYGGGAPAAGQTVKGGTRTNVTGLSLGGSTGPMFSNGQHVEDLQGGFNAASLVAGDVEVNSEWGPSTCKDFNREVSTQYVGWSTPGVSLWQGQSNTPWWWTPTPDPDC